MNDSSKTFYDLLKVERKATSDQIKESYREIAKVYHPDSNFYSEIISIPVDPAVEEKFKQLTEAYNTLMNAERRAEYDRTIAPELDGWDSLNPSLNSFSMTSKFKGKIYRSGFGVRYEEETLDTSAQNSGRAMNDVFKTQQEPSPPWLMPLLLGAGAIVAGALGFILIRAIYS